MGFEIQTGYGRFYAALYETSFSAIVRVTSDQEEDYSGPWVEVSRKMGSDLSVYISPCIGFSVSQLGLFPIIYTLNRNLFDPLDFEVLIWYRSKLFVIEVIKGIVNACK